MVERAVIRVKAMVYLPNAAGTHHAVLRGEDPADGRPMWVEWRPCDAPEHDSLPLYPDGVGALLGLG